MHVSPWHIVLAISLLLGDEYVSGRVISASGKGMDLGPIDINKGEQYIKCSRKSFTAKYETDRMMVFSTTKDELTIATGAQQWTTTYSGSGTLGPNKMYFISFLMAKNSRISVRLETDTRNMELMLIKGETEMRKMLNKENYDWAAKADQGETIANITDFVASDDYDEYFAVIVGQKYDFMEYSYTITVTYSLYDTDNMTAVCDGKLSCKLNSGKDQDFCAVFEYPKDALLPRAEIKFKGVGLSTKEIVVIAISVCIICICVVAICLVTHRMSRPKTNQGTAADGIVPEQQQQHQQRRRPTTTPSPRLSYSSSSSSSLSSSSSSSSDNNEHKHKGRQHAMMVTLSSSEEEDSDGKDEIRLKHMK